MFHYVKGKLALLRPSLAVLETGGVGFKLTISDRTYSSLAALNGGEAKLFTHLGVREDDLELFGFFEEQELDTFKLLTTVSYGLKNEKWLRIITLPSCVLWVIYNLYVGSYAGAIGDSIALVSLLIAMYKFDLKFAK